jgi:adenylosuccinate synthase
VTDQTKKYVSIQISKAIFNEFRSYCKTHGLKQYAELDKAVLFYLKYVSDTTDECIQTFISQVQKWEIP